MVRRTKKSTKQLRKNSRDNSQDTSPITEYFNFPGESPDLEYQNVELYPFISETKNMIELADVNIMDITRDNEVNTRVKKYIDYIKGDQNDPLNREQKREEILSYPLLRIVFSSFDKTQLHERYIKQMALLYTNRLAENKGEANEIIERLVGNNTFHIEEDYVYLDIPFYLMNTAEPELIKQSVSDGEVRMEKEKFYTDTLVGLIEERLSENFPQTVPNQVVEEITSLRNRVNIAEKKSLENREIDPSNHPEYIDQILQKYSDDNEKLELNEIFIIVVYLDNLGVSKGKIKEKLSEIPNIEKYLERVYGRYDDILLKTLSEIDGNYDVQAENKSTLIGKYLTNSEENS